MDEIPEAIFVENVPRYLKKNFKSSLNGSGEITEACAHEALVSFDQRVNQGRFKTSIFLECSSGYFFEIFRRYVFGS